MNQSIIIIILYFIYHLSIYSFSQYQHQVSSSITQHTLIHSTFSIALSLSLFHYSFSFHSFFSLFFFILFSSCFKQLSITTHSILYLFNHFYYHLHLNIITTTLISSYHHSSIITPFHIYSLYLSIISILVM